MYSVEHELESALAKSPANLIVAGTDAVRNGRRFILPIILTTLSRCEQLEGYVCLLQITALIF